MKKRLFLIIFAVTAVTVAAVMFCMVFQKEQEDNYREEKTELTISYANGDPTWDATMDYVVERFEEKYPDIKVKLLIETGRALYDDVLRSQAATGKLGDIVEIRDVCYFDSGYMAELPDFFESLVAYNYQKDGKIYGVNYNISTTGIIYNKKIYRLLGLSEPSTYQEFLDNCQTLKDAGYTPIIVGGADDWHLKHWINHFYLNDVIVHNLSWNEQLAQGEQNWTDGKVRTMFTHLYDLFHSGYIDEYWRTEKDSSMAAKMAEGKAGMLYGGPWYVKDIYSYNPGVEIGWFYLPDNQGNVCVRDITTNYFGISAKCGKDERKYEAAVRFLKFFFSKEIYKYVTNEMGGLSTVGVDEVSLNGIYREVWDKFEQAEIHSDSTIEDASIPVNFQSYLLQQIIDVLNDETPINEALVSCDSSYRRMMQDTVEDNIDETIRE